MAAGNALAGVLAGVLVEQAGWRAALGVACACAAVGAFIALARRRTLTPI